MTFQKLKCEALRGYLGMRPKDTGVLITGFRSGCVQPKLEVSSNARGGVRWPGRLQRSRDAR